MRAITIEEAERVLAGLGVGSERKVVVVGDRREVEAGPAQYTVAIIERDTGHIILRAPEHVRFIKDLAEEV